MIIKLENNATNFIISSSQFEKLNKNLEKANDTIAKMSFELSFTKDEIVREFVSANTDGGINVSAIHLETIIANQMRDPDDILSMPNWSIRNAPYKILTLGSALNNSPSITVTLEYQRIGKTLISPLSTRKNKPSVFDLYFMEKPQDYVENNSMISDKYNMKEDNDNPEIKHLKDGIYFIDKDKSDDTCE